MKPVFGLMLATSLVLAACGGDSTPAPAAPAAPTAPAETGGGTSESADATRDGMSMEELIAAAQAEGVVRLYTSRAEIQVQNSIAAFEEKYGVRVELYRAGGAQVAQRIELELMAGRPGADVVHLSDASYHFQAAERGFFVSYVPSNDDRIPAVYKDPNGFWYGTNVLGMPIIYNSELVTEAEAPKSYADLYGPDWAGRAGIGSPNYGATQTTNAVALFEIYGFDVFNQLEANDTFIGQGWPGIENAIIAGELLVGQTASTRLENALLRGQPLGWIEPEEGIIVGPAVIGILATAQNPNASRLWLEWETSDEGLEYYQSSWAVLTGFAFEGALPPLDQLRTYPVEPAVASGAAEGVRGIFRDNLE